MTAFVNLLVPPLVGAFIGYMTNYIAIRMLFRPLRTVRLFGLRVPFTPGIIPARRGELAVRLGRTVGRHLVTAEDARRALEKQTFQTELRQVVSDKLDAFLNAEHGPPATLLAQTPANWAHELGRIGEKILTDAVLDYVNGPAFETQLRTFIGTKGNAYLTMQLDELLSEASRRRVGPHLEQRIIRLTASPPFRQAVRGYADRKLAALLRSNRPLGSLLPPDATEMLFTLVRNEVPPLLEHVSHLLEDPVIRARLVDRLSARIRDLLKSLRGWSGFLAGFVNPDKISAQLPDFLDKAGQEIGDLLSEEETQERIAAMILERVQQGLNKPVREVVDKLPAVKVDALRAVLCEKLLTGLASPKTARLAATAIETGLHRIGEKTVADVLDYLLPEHGIESAQHVLTGAILACLRGPEFQEAAAQIVHEQVAVVLHRKPVGRLTEHVPAELREQLPDVLYEQLLDILRRELPPLLESLNVQKMVEDNVNSLPILDVEGILLAIMRRHFTHINLFGGCLGFLIGCLNSLWWILN